MIEPTKFEYHNALSNYFHMTKGYVFPSISQKIEDEWSSAKIPQGIDYSIFITTPRPPVDSYTRIYG